MIGYETTYILRADVTEDRRRPFWKNSKASSRLTAAR